MDNYKRTDLEKYICEVTKIPAVTRTISNQINRFCLEDHMTFKEIGRCVCYYLEVLHKKFILDYGIYFVENVRKQAEDYFKQLELDQQRQRRDAKKLVEYQDNNIIFNIKSLQHKKRKPKQLDIGEIIVKGEDDNESN